ncbi:hypothetical protein LAZ67_X001118 [Cordylochernes scorpioides]|uniref:Transposase n=1 Tax=Cordylochernes scorpioides TaxID=51811 RepID=A0ABY6LU93_9ARAC|nr:hypothetical protein LAZ67_X001118 [Cordylochernes scorpioides]
MRYLAVHLTLAKIAGYGLTLTSHPVYSPDLTPSEIYLFGRLKVFYVLKHLKVLQLCPRLLESGSDSRIRRFTEVFLQSGPSGRPYRRIDPRRGTPPGHTESRREFMSFSGTAD